MLLFFSGIIFALLPSWGQQAMEMKIVVKKKEINFWSSGSVVLVMGLLSGIGWNILHNTPEPQIARLFHPLHKVFEYWHDDWFFFYTEKNDWAIWLLLKHVFEKLKCTVELSFVCEQS